jgi:DNA binding domain, excisionase family
LKTEIRELTTEEAAEILDCSPRTIRNMIERGSIKARLVKVDPNAEKGAYRIPLSEIERIQKLQRTIG